MDRADGAWRILDNVGDWLRFSDSKAAVAITINLATIGWFGFAPPEDAWYSRLMRSGALASSVVSLLAAMYCVTPRLRVGESSSRIYFGHIAKRARTKSSDEVNCNSKAAFKLDFKELLASEEETIAEVADQVWVNAQVAWRKYVSVTVSLWALAVATTLMALFVLFPISSNGGSTADTPGSVVVGGFSQPSMPNP